MEVTGEFDDEMARFVDIMARWRQRMGLITTCGCWQWKYNARSPPVYPSAEGYDGLAQEVKLSTTRSRRGRKRKVVNDCNDDTLEIHRWTFL